MIELNLNKFEKQKIRIAGDDSRIIELDLSDMNIINRLSETLPEINSFTDKWNSLKEAFEEFQKVEENDSQKMIECINNYTNKFKSVEKEMREKINYIFDYDVCSPMIQNRSIFDICDGTYRFEYLINTLLDLYSESLSKESNKLQERMRSHTSKYLRG